MSESLNLIIEGCAPTEQKSYSQHSTTDEGDWQELCEEVNQSVEAAVHTIPFTNHIDSGDGLRVYSYPDFSEELTVEPEPLEQSELASAFAELQPMYWSLGGGCIVVSLLLVLLWVWKPRLIHAKSLDLQESDEAALGYPLETDEPVLAQATVDAAENLPQARELWADMIKQNPAQAATLIQEWASGSGFKSSLGLIPS